MPWPMADLCNKAELNYYFSNAPEALSEKGLVDA